jgi:hypothetical protein
MHGADKIPFAYALFEFWCDAVQELPSMSLIFYIFLYCSGSGFSVKEKCPGMRLPEWKETHRGH